MVEITPKTKVGELLDNYPQLEPVLLSLSPAFASLKNPVLRRTIARVASLQQAAAVGGMKVDNLVNHLRLEVGQEPLFGSGTASEYLADSLPDWFSESKITHRFDARDMIIAGGSPMNQILREAKSLSSGNIYKLKTPFVPAPVLDMLVNQGFMVCSQNMEDFVVSYIFKK